MDISFRTDRIRRDIETLATFNATPGEGLTRLSYTPEHAAAAEYIINEMRAAGLAVRVDAVGNIIGRLEGAEPELPCVMLGSHFDSVRHGGNFDGQAGVCAALECARAIRDAGITPRRSMEFTAIMGEEGARFDSGIFGSRAMTGRVRHEDLELNRDDDGVNIAGAMRAFGLDPERIDEARRGPDEIAYFLEMHIEQGPVLEHAGMQLGIVEAIVGLRSLEVTITGRPDHAGTTPMDLRADALLAAARLAVELNALAVAAGNATVATVGRLAVQPGSSNIVPGFVRFSVDIRSPKAECVESVERDFCALVAALEGEGRGVRGEVRTLMGMEPVTLDGHVQSVLREKADECGFTHMDLPSGAGHDSMFIADIARVGMLFVPSKNGRSHCPEEWTDYEELRCGVEVTSRAALALANE